MAEDGTTTTPMHAWCSWCDDDDFSDGRGFDVIEQRLCSACAAAKAAEQDQWPVLKLMRRLTTQAVRERATAMRIEFRDDRACIQYRIDGALHDRHYLFPRVGRRLLRRLRKMTGEPKLGAAAASGGCRMETKHGAVVLHAASHANDPAVDVILSYTAPEAEKQYGHHSN